MGSILIIRKLEVENFKGIVSLTVEFGKRTNISGANATGKTSIPDAYSWLLFNKDSAGNSPGNDTFREKPLDENGQEIHNLATSVKATFTLNGAPFILQRIQRENWVKPRGQTQAEFAGNTSLYYINEVETKAGDFRSRIEEIADDAIFQLITTLGAFNAMDWKRRRAILLGASGADVEDRILAGADYQELRTELAERNVSIDDLKKVLFDQRRKINAELQVIPARIDEAKRLRPDVSEQDASDAKKTITEAQEEVATLDTRIAELRVSASAEDHTKEIETLERERSRTVTALQRERMDATAGLRAEAENAAANLKNIEARAMQLRFILKEAKEHEEASANELQELRRAYIAAKEQPFDIPSGINSVCPACGQDIPEAQYTAAITQAREDFARKKAATCSRIAADGDAVKLRAEDWAARASSAAEELTKIDLIFSAAVTQKEKADAAIKAIPIEPDYYADPRVTEYTRTIDSLKAQQNTSTDEAIAALKRQQASLRRIIGDATLVLNTKATAEKHDARITELEKTQRDLGEKISALEIKIALIDRFVTERCNALEESINLLFPTVRWKLFDTQINGGLIDVCNCMIPCEGALVAYSCANTAAQINADIEISNVLSEFYGVTAPLFVDNAERINYLAVPRGQLITLTVAPETKPEELAIIELQLSELQLDAENPENDELIAELITKRNRIIRALQKRSGDITRGLTIQRT